MAPIAAPPSTEPSLILGACLLFAAPVAVLFRYVEAAPVRSGRGYARVETNETNGKARQGRERETRLSGGGFESGDGQVARRQSANYS